MKRGKRRIRAMVLAVVMFVSLFQGIPGIGENRVMEVQAASKSQTEALQWVKSQIGNSIDADGVDGAQCVDLISAYYDFLGVPRSSGNGSDYTHNALPSGWVRLKGATPQPGDILVYTDGFENLGHVAIFESERSTYHQNFIEYKGERSYVKHITAYSYKGISNPYWGVIRPNFGTQPTNMVPDGCVDNAAGQNGQIYVSGWAFDRDCPSASLYIHVYIGADAQTAHGQPDAVIRADRFRPDVNAAYGVGDYHGFEDTIKTNKVGLQNIYIYAINVDANGNDAGLPHPLIGQRTANILPAIDYKVNTANADKINNTSAVISGSLSPSGTAASWGFYLGENSTNMKYYTVSAGATASGSMSANTSAFEKLKPGTNYYYQVWANVNDQIKTGEIRSFWTTAVKPEIPVLKVDTKSKEIGIADAPSVSWNNVAQTEYYKLRLYGPDGELVETSEEVTGNKYAFKAVEKDGTYTVSVEAYNSVGSKGESQRGEIVVHPDVTVKFMNADTFVDAAEDYEPEVLSEQKVHWGKDASKPADPSHTGYTFSKWDGVYTDVKEDMVVKAVYTIQTYNVTFMDSMTSKELGSQKVEYYSAALPPDFDVPTGYKKTGYNGWDKNYKCITEDTTLYSCIGWYNENFPIYAELLSAVREYDAEESDNEGYTVKVRLTNWEEKATKGRVVVALKTEKGKLLTTTESSAFSIKKSAKKELEIFVPYDKAASIAEIYVVGQYKDAVPITTTASNNAVGKIDQSMTYTNWSEQTPPADALHSESRQEYRYQDKDVQTSYATSLPGYIQSGSQWVQSGSGAIDYVNSWPAGFNRSSGYFSAYNRTPLTPYENSTNKRTVSTTVSAYIYWHWCRGTYTSGPVNRRVSDGWSSEFGTFHAYVSGPLGYNASSGAFQNSRPDVCRDTYWWLGMSCWSGNSLPVYRCNYTDYRKLFSYFRWSDFSDWGTTPYAATSSRNVQTRTVYRYQTDDMMQQDDSGEERVVKGTLGENFAGKEAALFIYKVDEASDYTNEYVAQTVLDAGGNYEFRFKLREEPTAETGDFTIVLGAEGTSTAIFLDKIEAPKKEYTVTFYDYNGDVISEETVTEGATATLPDEKELQREGYTFVRWSDTNVNITSDKEIYPEYELNKYNVVFIDWEASTVEVKEFEYGAQLVAPQAQEPEAEKTVEWDAIADGKTVVTDNMIVTTRYTTKTCRVQIMDFDNKVISDEAVRYGDAANLPNIDVDDSKYIFLGWKNVANGCDEAVGENVVKQNVILCPDYVYVDTTQDPVASLEAGAYDEAKTVTLSCSTENADIYYTLDGSNPKGYGATLYTEPIVIDDAVELRFYACSIGRNDSAVQSKLYAVNYEGAMSRWMVKDELPQEVRENMSDYDLYSETGYTYKDKKTTIYAQEAASLESSGWTLVEGEESYTDYSDWSKEYPDDLGNYIAIDVDSKPEYMQASKYVYSHYAYMEGTAAKYASDEPEGKDSTYEETEEFEKPLNIAGFDENENPYYVFDGQTWYNQKRITGNVQIGTAYRWRYKTVTYEKWSDYSTDEPAENEEREYQSTLVYSYVRHKNYIVRIFSSAEGTAEAYSCLAEAGSKIDAQKYENIVGYTFDGFYLDEAYEDKWDYKNETVAGNMDLYAKYTPERYTVTFVDQDENEISVQEINYLGKADAPEMKDTEGYRFIGWDTQDYLRVTYDMQVKAKYIPEDEYATVQLDNEKIKLYVGKAADLTAIVRPAEKFGTELEWVSDDTSVAVVSKTGKVTGVGAGTANVSVTVKETGESAVCRVVVQTDLETTIGLLKNSRLKKDSYGYLRGIKVGANTVSELGREFENSLLQFKDADGNTLSDDSAAGTGARVILMSGDKELDSITMVVTGDISGDGVISNRDVSMLARALLEKEQPTDIQILAGDVNGDGEINNKDISMISRIRLGKETF